MKIMLSRAAVLSILGMASTIHGRLANITTTNNTGGPDDGNEGSVWLPGWASGFTRHRFGDNATSHAMYPESTFKFDNNIDDTYRLGRAKLSTSNNEDEDEDIVHDVVIVAAGAAGMGAARRLILSGVKRVVILEATSGLGGRMQVDKDFTGFPLDLGPSYLPGQFFKRELEQIAGRSLPTTNLLWKNYAYNVLNLLWKNYSYNDFFTDYVAPDLDIRYNCVVIEVDYQEENDYTRIKCADGHTFLAQYTVVTASIQILKDKDIDFTPTIDPKLYNHRDLWPGFKIFLQYDNKFYNNRFSPLQPEFDSTGEDVCWDGTVSAPDRNNASNLLVCYFTGNRADNICCTPNESKNKVETIFEKYFNLRQGSINTERYLIVDWSSKPFIKGTYSDVSNKPNFNPPVVNPGGKNTLIIAGEAYPIPGEEYGWVYSAFHSGYNTADQIMEIMAKRPDSCGDPPPNP